MKRIDPHVHCRDGKESYKATIKEVSKLAEKEGIVHICDMPNTNPPIFREKDVIARLELVKNRHMAVGYSLFVGLTSDEEQIREAADVARRYKEVVGLKLYPPENEEIRIYRILSKLKYRGVLAVHAEKKSLFRPDLFNHEQPWTHGAAQPPEAETESIKEQIRFAKETDFRGTLYICHITLPESAEIIWQEKKYLRIFAEVTPHHLLLDNSAMEQKRTGILFKVNPPLRSHEAVKKLFTALKQGKIDCIGTDYAPHSLIEKTSPPYLSGIASYELYGVLLDFLRKNGISEEKIADLTYWNIKEIFEDKLNDV